MANIIRGGGMTPDGSITISANGIHNVEDYESAIVNVSGALKVVQCSFGNGGGTSNVLDSYNSSTGTNETDYYSMSAASWGQGGAASQSCYVQGSNDRSSWTNVKSAGGTYPSSAHDTGIVSGYRYYRFVFTGTMQKGHGTMACAGLS